MEKEKVIDPKTTRRTVTMDRYKRNAALYATYEVVQYLGTQGEPHSVLLQKKPEHCRRKR
jgi:hypothetical protein